MGEKVYEDFSYVGTVTGSKKQTFESGDVKFRLSTEGAGSDARVTSRTIAVWEKDKNGKDHPYMAAVREAIEIAAGVKDGNPITFVFTGYKEPAEQKGFFYTAQKVEPWDGSMETPVTSPSQANGSAPTTRTQTTVPQVSKPSPEDDAKWALQTVLENHTFFGEVPADPKERAGFVETKAVGLLSLVKRVTARVGAPPASSD